MGDLHGKKNLSEPPSTLVTLLRRYVEEVDAIEKVDATETSEPADDSADNGSNGAGETSTELRYAGLQKTTTGVVALMREQGNNAAADLLEELRLARNDAAALLNRLRDLHKKKTGSYPAPAITITRTANPKDR